MSVALLTVAFAGTWNVFRFHPALPAGLRTRAQRIGTVLLGAALTLAAVLVVAVVADDLLDWLEITPATARIAVGAVVAIAGLRDLVTAPPDPEPTLAGWKAALVPVLFPFLFSPPAALLSVSGSADQGTATCVTVAAAALVPLVIASAFDYASESSAAQRVERGLHRIVAGVLVLAAFALVVDGIFDI